MNFGRSKRIFAIAYLGMLLSLAGRGESAHGAYTLYSSQASFLAAAGSGVSTENFDGLAASTRFSVPLTLDGVTYASTSPNSQWIVIPGSPGLIPTESSPNDFLLTPGFSSALLWFNGGSSTAFGLALIASGAISPSSPLVYSVDAFDTSGTAHVSTLILTAPGVAYYGIVASGGSLPIGELAITSTPGGESVLLDDVSHGTITPGSFTLLPPLANVAPEPSSLVMLGSGLFGLVLLRRTWN